MEFFIICLAALVTSGLTLFSGFGLGTLLMPVFAIFSPIEIAIAMTAVVHFANNIFKLILLGKYANMSIVLLFGIPAIFAAFIGAWLLLGLSDLHPILNYNFIGKNFQVLPVKLVIAILMIFFALFEVIPKFEKISFEKKYLPIGGTMSGFFGGLSGHQGALRSAFLIKCGLTKESFISTGVIIACMVDITRLSIYSTHFLSVNLEENIYLLIAAILSAFLGAYIGNKLLKKVTLHFIQILVAILLFLIAIGLGTGII